MAGRRARRAEPDRGCGDSGADDPAGPHHPPAVVTTTSAWPIVLRGGVVIEDPLSVVLGFLARWRIDVGDPSASFGEPDLRLANRGGARVSAAQIAAILDRRPVIERALRAIPPGASLSAEVNSV